jgi:hypothetical protein
MDDTFRERFRNATPQQLVDALNRVVGNPGSVSARGFYIAALTEAFLATGLDCSSFIKGGRLTLVYVRLNGDEVVPVAGPPRTARILEAPPPTLESTDSTPVRGVDLQDSQSLIDALIRSMEWRNDARIQEFGAQLVAQWGAFQGAGEDGVLRLFDELEATHFVVELLGLSDERWDELEEGDDLTEEEAALLADVVEERCFQSDGSDSHWWEVARIESSDGFEAYVAQTLEDGGLWTRPTCCFVDVLPSLHAAKQALKRLGYIDGEDFRCRYPSRTDR